MLKGPEGRKRGVKIRLVGLFTLALFMVAGAKCQANQEYSSLSPVGSERQYEVSQTVSNISTQFLQENFAVSGNLDPFADDVRPHTETLFITEHVGKLYAATGQWKSPELTGAQILVKESPTADWHSFKDLAVVRASALSSFEIPAELNEGNSVEVLLAFGRDYPQESTIEAIQELPKGIFWMVGDKGGFDSFFSLPSDGDIRSFGAVQEGNEFAFYAGINPSGVLRGVWDPDTQSILWGSDIELSVVENLSNRAVPPIAGKVTGFAPCGGDLYVTIRRNLFRRSSDTGEWNNIYSIPVTGDANSGFRGLTCTSDSSGQPALLISAEGIGAVYRLENLSGQPNPILELDIRQAIATALARSGVAIPRRGDGSVGYVISAYNEFTPVIINGQEKHMFGVEWGYRGRGICPEGLVCQPGPGAFAAYACFFVRDATGTDPQYSFQCLGGEDFTPQPNYELPVTRGEAFVAVRAIHPSPWDPSRIYLGGYDANDIPSFNTAWIGSISTQDIRLAEEFTFNQGMFISEPYLLNPGIYLEESPQEENAAPEGRPMNPLRRLLRRLGGRGQN